MPKAIKTLLKIVTILVVVIFLALLGLNYYLNRHKKELFAKVETWYSDAYNGTLIFDNVGLSTLKNLPNVTFTVKNLMISDCHYSQTDVLSVGELQISVSLAKLLQKKIEVKFVKIWNGELNLITDSEGISNSRVFLSKIRDSSYLKEHEIQFSEKAVKLSIKNFSVAFVDHCKNKRITGHVNDIGSLIHFQDELITAVIDLDLEMQEMGLNLEKGTFFNDAHLRASYELSFDKEKKEIDIPEFDLQIDQQSFDVTALLRMKDEGTFHFTLENKKTLLKPSIGLLNQHIQDKLKRYHISKPIYTYTLLEGDFAPGSNVFVSVTASTKNNSITVDKTQLENVTFHGNFTNRANAQGENIAENKKNLRLHFEALSGLYKNIPFAFSKAIYTSTPEVKNLLDFNLHSDADAILLNDFFKNKNFVFTAGKFEFDTEYIGNLMSVDSLVDASMSSLRFGKSSIMYVQEQLEFGIDTIVLELNKKNAFLKQLVLPIKGTDSKVVFTGNIMNVSSLVLDRNEKMQSELDVYSASLVWDDFYYLFQTPKQKKVVTPKKDAVVIDKMIEAFYVKFNPELKVKIDKFQYNKLIVSDFTTFIHFTSRSEVELKNTGFTFDDKGKVRMEMKMDFSKTDITKLDFDLHIDADATLLNDFFDNKNFVFTDGKLEFDTQYSGNLMSMDSLVDASTSSLRFGKSSIMYIPEQLELSIDTIALEINKKDAFLTQLVFPIRGTNSKILFTGNITNVSSLVLDRNEKVHSELDVYSASLVWDDFYYLFKTAKPKKASSPKADAVVIDKMIDAFYTKFDPELKVKIDKFQYNKLIVTDFTTLLRFISSDEVMLENTGFTYHDKGRVNMEMRLDVSSTDITKFDFDLTANQLDLGDMLKEFDYFNIASLKNAEKLAGNISMDADFQGDIIRTLGLDHNTLVGTIRFDLADLEINGFEPIIKVADKIFKKQRFENIKIGPIKDSLFIAHRTIHFPQMEIQSTAFDLFVEGQLNYDNKTNIWVSVPLSNLKSRDLVDIPDPEGFIAAGRKVYVQIKDDGTGKLEYKLHLNNKKLYEEKGIADQYKEDRNEAKQIRKRTRKEDRKEARANKKDSIQ